MTDLSPDQSMTLAMVLGAVIAVVLLIDICLFLAWIIRRPAVVAGEAAPIFSPRWSLVDVWLTGQIVIVIVNVLALGVMIVIGFWMALMQGGHLDVSRMQQDLQRILVPVSLLSIIPQTALFVGVPALVIVKKYHQSLASIGFTLRPSGEDIRRGVLWGGAMLVVGMPLLILASIGMRSILGAGHFAALEKLTKAIGNENLIKGAMASPLMGALVLFSAGFLAPLGEEFFFRGFLFNAAKRRFGLWPGVWISAVVFALVHAGPLLVLGIIPIGVVLALAYERTRSLWVTIFMHATFNSVQILWMYFKLPGG